METVQERTERLEEKDGNTYILPPKNNTKDEKCLHALLAKLMIEDSMKTSN